MLAGFGSNRVTTTPVNISTEEQGTAYFTAPELLSPTDFGLEKGVPSKEADVYALGMTVYQVLTRNLPFFPRSELEVMLAVTLGERPPKPENAERIGMTEVVWDLLKECWKEDWTARPTITQVWETFDKVTSENGTTDPTLRRSAAPQLGAHKRSSVFSQNSSPTAGSCECSRLCSLCISSPDDLQG